MQKYSLKNKFDIIILRIDDEMLNLADNYGFIKNLKIFVDLLVELK